MVDRNHVFLGSDSFRGTPRLFNDDEGFSPVEKKSGMSKN